MLVSGGQLWNGLPGGRFRPIRVSDPALRAVERTLPRSERMQAQEAARGFEGLLMQILVQAMRRSVSKSGLLGNSFASQMYEQMFDERLSDALAAGGGIGIAERLYAEVLRQEQGRRAYQAALSGAQLQER
ncbi:MAG: hypothetical protein KatS3mg115_2284 [Candidatus Poribacteria bacterium]|nr:MAG: hypothetical protein KatS3mg115_2284 [Candidatus Poribacteria bacterium]